DYRLASVRRTLTIGRFPEVGLTAARDAVSAARALVAQGISPSRAKQEKKAAAELDRKNTLKARAEDWYAAKAPTRSKSWRRNARRWLDGDIYPTIGDKPIRNVTAGDIEDLVKATAKKRQDGVLRPAAVGRRVQETAAVSEPRESGSRRR